jgi:hypothetical protein
LITRGNRRLRESAPKAAVALKHVLMKFRRPNFGEGRAEGRSPDCSLFGS